MAQPNYLTPNAVGPIRDSNAQRVCSMAGIRTAQEKVVDLHKLRDGLDNAIKDLEHQRRWDKAGNTAFLVLRFTKASCDAFISMAAALSPNKKAEKIESLYNMGSAVAEATSTTVQGGKGDWWNVGTTVTKEGVGLVAGKKLNKANAEVAKIMTNSTVVKVEVIKAAMNDDKKAMIKSSASYIVDLNASIAENHLGERGEIGAKLAKIAKAGFEYNDKIGEAFDTMLEDDYASQERFDSSKRTLLHCAKMLSKQIGEMESFISDCQNMLSQPPANDASKAPSLNRA